MGLKYKQSVDFAQMIINRLGQNLEAPEMEIDENDGSVDLLWKNKTSTMAAKIENDLLFFVGILNDETVSNQVCFNSKVMPHDFISYIAKYFQKPIDL